MRQAPPKFAHDESDSPTWNRQNQSDSAIDNDQDHDEVHRRRQIVFGKHRATPIGAISIFLTVSSLFAIFADP